MYCTNKKQSSYKMKMTKRIRALLRKQTRKSRNR